MQVILTLLEQTGEEVPVEAMPPKRRSRGGRRLRERRERAAAKEAVKQANMTAEPKTPRPELEPVVAAEQKTDNESLEYLRRVSPQLVRNPRKTWYWTLSTIPGHPRYLRASPRLRAAHDTRLAEMREHCAGGLTRPHIRATADGTTYHVMQDGTAVPCFTLPEVLDVFDAGGWHISGPLALVAELAMIRADHVAAKPRSVAAFLADSEEAEWLGTYAIPETVSDHPNMPAR